MTGDVGYRVSVVVPTRDRPEMLSQSLASIRALEGDDLSFEILVGDNGDMAKTRDIVASFGAIHLPAGPSGAGAARNAALRAATGDYIAFLDDDDIWLPGHLRGHLDLLRTNPHLDAVIGQVVSTDAQLQPISGPWPGYLPPETDFFLMMLNGYFPQIGATVVRAKVRDSVGEFDESLIGDQDWDWQIRVAKAHKIGFVETPCILFRQRPPGTFDDLQMRRVSFTRRVFLRHALPARKRWRSPLELVRSYFAAVTPYFNYFVEVAIARSEQGERRGALQAMSRALRIFPTRGLRMLARPTPLREALRSVIVQPNHGRTEGTEQDAKI